MIVSSTYYYGTPKSLIFDLEKVSQAVVTELFSVTEEIFNILSAEKDKKYFNDCDYKITNSTVIDKFKDRWSQLIIEDYSSGWWAVLKFARPFNNDKGITDFYFYANQGKPPKKLDWAKFQNHWGLSTCDLYMTARRLNKSDSWYAPVHTLDFKHPLLLNLNEALDELKEIK